MQKFFISLVMFLLVVPSLGYAKAGVVEGDDAKKLYEKEKKTAKVLVQKNKEFTLRLPDGKEIEKPEQLTVKIGERFYIVNEEDTFVHNVYDVTDSSWVLTKQLPGNVAAVTFEDAGTHMLRCAIHPIMHTNVKVVQ